MTTSLTFRFSPNLHCSVINIYRDNDKINKSPLTSPEFDDTTNDGLEHVYNVTAVYDKGESRPSADLKIAFSNTNVIPASNISVFAIDGGIRITGAEGGFTIYSASGSKVACGSSSEATVALRPGIYIITTAAGTIKTAVR